jgi:hypothetical protein
MMLRTALLILAITLTTPALNSVRAADDPSDRWMHAFVLLQTGSQLGERELWPLAIANYVTALEYFEKLATENPEYEPALIRFRVEDLKKRIITANESMNASDHDIVMHYIDFIETSNQGQNFRYTLRFAESYPLLSMALLQIEDLIDLRPDELGPALADQRAHLESIVEDTRNQLMKDAEGAKILNEIEKRFHFANAILGIELPRDPEVALSPELFPDALQALVRDQ